MMTKQNSEITALVIYCGFSSEKKISEKTGNAVINALRNKGVNVIPYILTAENVSDISKEKFDVAFIALHGKYGEDGTLQGYLELIGKKYCGTGVLGSALCIDKYYAKVVMLQNSLPTPEFLMFESSENVDYNSIKLPAVIKPIDEGSSIGMSIVFEKENIKSAFELAFSHSKKVMVEKYINGREITVAVIERDKKITPLPIIEIAPKHKYFDYEAKYTKGLTEYIVPAVLNGKLAEKINDLAAKTFKALNCKDFSRIDMMIDADENVFILEANTIPGMTETSLLPKAAAAAGIPFDDLILYFIKNNL